MECSSSRLSVNASTLQLDERESARRNVSGKVLGALFRRLDALGSVMSPVFPLARGITVPGDLTHALAALEEFATWCRCNDRARGVSNGAGVCAASGALVHHARGFKQVLQYTELVIVGCDMLDEASLAPLCGITRGRRSALSLDALAVAQQEHLRLQVEHT